MVLAENKTERIALCLCLYCVIFNIKIFLLSVHPFCGLHLNLLRGLHCLPRSEAAERPGLQTTRHGRPRCRAVHQGRQNEIQGQKDQRQGHQARSRGNLSDPDQLRVDQSQHSFQKRL